METPSLHKYGPVYTVKEHLQCRRVPYTLKCSFTVYTGPIFILRRNIDGLVLLRICQDYCYESVCVSAI